MLKKISCLIILGALLWGMPHSAAQASQYRCGPYSTHNYDLVFDGRHMDSRPATKEEAAELAAADLKLGHDVRVHRFRVVYAWKGTKANDVVEIYQDTSLVTEPETETDYYPSTIYLISARQLGDFYFQPSRCRLGKTAPGVLKALLDELGEGHDFKIMGEDMACDTEQDCTAIVTRCSECACGTVLSKSALDKYTRIKDEVCGDYEGASCDKDCPTPQFECRDDRCRILPPNPASYK